MRNSVGYKEKIVIVFFSFLVFVYASYEVYITNVGEFWFSIKHFLPMSVCIATIISCGCFLCLKRIPKYSNGVILFIFWMELCIYVQGTFLNLDIGQLTGLSFSSREYIVYYVRDALVWLALAGAVYLSYRKYNHIYNKVLMYVPTFLLFVLIITGVTLFITNCDREFKKSGETTFCSDYGITEFGEEDNIIVFVLDMFDSRYLEEIEKTYSEDLESFNGFSEYTNHVGGYATTAYSLAFLNSGEYFRNEMLLEDFVNSRESYIEDLVKEGYDVANYGAYGYPGRLYKYFSNYIDGRVKVKKWSDFIVHIYEMGAFRYAPNVCKVALMRFHDKLGSDMSVKSDYPMHSDDNIDTYNSIIDSETEIKSGKKYKMIYVKGVHYPYENDEELNKIGANHNESPVLCARGALKLVAAYLDKMKELGVYDAATIIVTADHGYFSDYGMDEYSRPIMLIKRKGSRGIITHNTAPTSHVNFAATVEHLVTGEEQNRFGESIFAIGENDKRDRFYYHYYLKEKGDSRRLIEFRINDKSDDIFELTGNEYTTNGEIINHFDYCYSCQTGNHDGKGLCWHIKADNYPD